MIRVRLLFLVALIVGAPLGAAAQTPPGQPAASPQAPQAEAAPGAAQIPPPAGAPAAVGAPASVAIEQGSTVKLEYTLSDDAGTVFDSNKGKPPLTYTHGDHQIMPALEKQLLGMHPGEEKHVVLAPEEAYGPVNPAAQAEVPREMLPAESLNVGAHLIARNAEGQVRPVTVKEVREKTVVLDLNHPLAGKTIVFDLKVIGVEPPGVSESRPTR
jgi:FKBP-type peptidyl-prolyl cis-trans isomerase 2